MKSPYIWFGNKELIADAIWQRLGDIQSYIEPFFGSGVIYLSRPSSEPLKVAVLNDLDGMVVNFWRAIKFESETVAFYADCPASQADYHARIGWIVNRSRRLPYLLEDPDYYDAKLAGFWLYVTNMHLGRPATLDGNVVSNGVEIFETKCKDLPRFYRQLPTTRRQRTTSRAMQHLWPPQSDAGSNQTPEVIKNLKVYQWMQELALHFRYAHLLCTDWVKTVKPSIISDASAPIGIVLDPPYSGNLRDPELYVAESLDVSANVRAWCIENGNDPKLRIVLCGYEGEHEMPPDWDVLEWKGKSGYSALSKDQNARSKHNRRRERVWFSPHCLRPDGGVQATLVQLSAGS